MLPSQCHIVIQRIKNLPIDSITLNIGINEYNNVKNDIIKNTNLFLDIEFVLKENFMRLRLLGLEFVICVELWLRLIVLSLISPTLVMIKEILGRTY